jgi:DNA-binding response OmpR family regulator
VAADADEALSLVERATRPFDLLLTDLVMPRMKGDELARRLRRQQNDLKVLYLTGFCEQLFAVRSTLWADEAFLEKPCAAEGLVEAVSLMLSGRLPTRTA